MSRLLGAADLVGGYGEVDILRGVSLHVDAGEVVAVIGPNGAGKSTLLKAIFGLIHVRLGRVTFNHADVTNESPDRIVSRGMSYVPQTDNVFPSLSINENLEMGGFVRRDGLGQRLERMYQLFPDLAARRRDVASKLSGGQRQMLALARALMLDPQLVLLDEPSASLSPLMVEVVFEKIREINTEGTAILLVEQNAREALSHSDRAYVLAMGENRLEGLAGEMLDNEEVGRVYLGE